ncbi:MAG: hypothetical protein QXM31_02875 [Candidatus Woesearchaeota archaeon]
MADAECLESKLNRENLRISEQIQFSKKHPAAPDYNPYSFPQDDQFDIVLKTVSRGISHRDALKQYLSGKDAYIDMYQRLKPNDVKVSRPRSKNVAVSHVDGLCLVTDENSFYAGISKKENVFVDFASTMHPRIFGMYVVRHDFIAVRETPVKLLIEYLEAMQNYPPLPSKCEQAAGIKAYKKYLNEGGSADELLDSMLRLYVAHEHGEKGFKGPRCFSDFQNVRDLFANLESAKEYESIGIPRLRHGVYSFITQVLRPEAFHKRNDWHFSRILLLASFFTESPFLFYSRNVQHFSTYKTSLEERYKKIMTRAQELLWEKTNKYLNS